jgi:hypothetical protein
MYYEMYWIGVCVAYDVSDLEMLLAEVTEIVVVEVDEEMVVVVEFRDQLAVLLGCFEHVEEFAYGEEHTGRCVECAALEFNK